MLKCEFSIKGFTIGKTYKIIACAGDLVQLMDDNGNKITIEEIYFNIS